MIECKLLKDKKIIIESLQRMGIAIRNKNILYPSVYLFEHEGKSYLCHFKELFSILKDGTNETTNEDYERLNSIAFCLYNWGLISIDDLEKINPHKTFIFVLPYTEKKNWRIIHKIKYYNQV